jgi:hypothetical protein
MLKDLVKVANCLDSLGLSKEANLIDRMIKKYSVYHDVGLIVKKFAGEVYWSKDELNRLDGGVTISRDALRRFLNPLYIENNGEKYMEMYDKLKSGFVPDGITTKEELEIAMGILYTWNNNLYSPKAIKYNYYQGVDKLDNILDYRIEEEKKNIAKRGGPVWKKILESLTWKDGTDLENLEEIIGEYLFCYEESRDFNNPDHGDSSIYADDKRGEISQFIRKYAANINDGNIYDFMEALVGALNSEVDD